MENVDSIYRFGITFLAEQLENTECTPSSENRYELFSEDGVH